LNRKHHRQGNWPFATSIDFFKIILAIATLFCGQFLPETRMIFFGLPLNTIIFIFAICFVVGNPSRGVIAPHVLFLFAPVLLMGISLCWSGNVEYGLHKLANLFLSSFLSVYLTLQVTSRRTLDWVFSIWLTVMTLLLFIVFIYKVLFGFFNREVLFFLNGPIVFARFMGGAAIMSLLIFSGARKWIFYSMFLLAVIWTYSKGPLLSVFIITLVYLYRKHGFFNFIILLLILSVSSLILLNNNKSFKNKMIQNRYGSAIQSVLNHNIDSKKAFGSIGIRRFMYYQSVDMIKRFPFGVGAGGWQSQVDESLGLQYPHNFFLEVISENGWVIGMIAFIPFIIFLLKWESLYSLLPLFFLFAQQFSGDLLDARYLLSFSLVVFLSLQSPLQRTSTVKLKRSFKDY